MRASCKLHWIAAALKRLAMTCERFNRIRYHTLRHCEGRSSEAIQGRFLLDRHGG